MPTDCLDVGQYLMGGGQESLTLTEQIEQMEDLIDWLEEISQDEAVTDIISTDELEDILDSLEDEIENLEEK